MKEAEFDRFAEEYEQLHKGVVGITGESLEYFIEYKVKDTIDRIHRSGLDSGALSILDFGSGVGQSISFFSKYLSDCQLTCLDVSNRSLEIAHTRYGKKAEFVQFDGNSFPFSSFSFDVVFTSCVFHHIPHAEHRTLISEIYKVLRPNGIFIAFEHNPYNFFTVRAVNSCPFDENAALIKGKQFKRLVHLAGFKEDTLHYRLFFPRFLRFMRPLEKLITWLPIGAQYYVFGRKVIT